MVASMVVYWKYLMEGITAYCGQHGSVWLELSAVADK